MQEGINFDRAPLFHSRQNRSYPQYAVKRLDAIQKIISVIS